MIKNRPIKSLVSFIATAIAILNGILFFIGVYFFDNATSFVYTIIAISILIILNFALVKWLLDKSIFDKIKVLYKFISPHKLTSQQKKEIDINKQSLEDVKTDVEQWTEKTNKEIEVLKNLEEYRKNFLGNISHELKTPLFSIQGYIHTLIDGGIYDNNINMKYLVRASKNIDRLQHIVDDLEIINQLRSNELTLKITTFDLISLIENTIEDLEVMAKEKKIKVRFKVEYTSPLRVKADYKGVQQVISNLIVNSIKYGKLKGTTTVGIFHMDDKYLIEITDNGEGIEEHHIKHLFDRFYRVEDSRSRKVGGSGLGLSIVKHILEAHNEQITVRSTPGIGSTFGFTLPKA